MSRREYENGPILWLGFPGTGIFLVFVGVVVMQCVDWDKDGVSNAAGDCEPKDGRVAPGLPEICDGLDNNCDGELMEGEEDADGDGYLACHTGIHDWDCDDNDPEVNPGMTGSCNGKGNNNGERQQGLPALPQEPGPDSTDTYFWLLDRQLEETRQGELDPLEVDPP
ncbi:MAG: putative metal-binding motif-containing protein [Patescibacteria group bacterium]|nr:putative metal-binding motif-containing protein [Patescibacteria group bacterium]